MSSDYSYLKKQSYLNDHLGVFLELLIVSSSPADKVTSSHEIVFQTPQGLLFEHFKDFSSMLAFLMLETENYQTILPNVQFHLTQLHH